MMALVTLVAVLAGAAPVKLSKSVELAKIPLGDEAHDFVLGIGACRKGECPVEVRYGGKALKMEWLATQLGREQFAVRDGVAKVASLLVPSEGFGFAYDLDRPEGQRIVAMTLDGKRVQPEARYRVTVRRRAIPPSARRRASSSPSRFPTPRRHITSRRISLCRSPTRTSI